MHKIECPRCLGGKGEDPSVPARSRRCVFSLQGPGVCRGENHPEAFYPVCCYAEMGKSRGR